MRTWNRMGEPGVVTLMCLTEMKKENVWNSRWLWKICIHILYMSMHVGNIRKSISRWRVVWLACAVYSVYFIILRSYTVLYVSIFSHTCKRSGLTRHNFFSGGISSASSTPFRLFGKLSPAAVHNSSSASFHLNAARSTQATHKMAELRRNFQALPTCYPVECGQLNLYICCRGYP